MIYVIHLIANDLIQSGGEDAKQIEQIKAQIDKNWLKLDRKFQASAIFKGRITLHFPGEVRYRDPDEEVQ